MKHFYTFLKNLQCLFTVPDLDALWAQFFGPFKSVVESEDNSWPVLCQLNTHCRRLELKEFRCEWWTPLLLPTQSAWKEHEKLWGNSRGLSNSVVWPRKKENKIHNSFPLSRISEALWSGGKMFPCELLETHGCLHPARATVGLQSSRDSGATKGGIVYRKCKCLPGHTKIWSTRDIYLLLPINDMDEV